MKYYYEVERSQFTDGSVEADSEEEAYEAALELLNGADWDSGAPFINVYVKTET